MTKEEIREYCLYQHVAEFYRQNRNDEEADFAKPCSECKLALRECQLDWIGNFMDEVPEGIKFDLGHR